MVLIIHLVLVEPCMELLISGIYSLAINSDVYPSVRLHAILVQGYVDTTAYAKALKQLGDILGHIYTTHHLHICSQILS